MDIMAQGEIRIPVIEKVVTLDKIDERIIHELVKNCRTPASIIAKKVHARKERVLYRIQRLFKEGIIASTYAEFNIRKLGYSRYNVLLRTKNLQKIKQEELVQFLICHPYVSWVVTGS